MAKRSSSGTSAAGLLILAFIAIGIAVAYWQVGLVVGGLVVAGAAVYWSRRRASPEPGEASSGERERRDLRAATLPAGHEYVIQGPGLDVVGESRYRESIEAVVGKRPEGHQDIVDAALVWEPHNLHDPNAVAVVIDGRTCGYLSRAAAAAYRPVMEQFRRVSVAPVARADIRGGWREDNGHWADFGITLYIASPEKLLGRADLDAPQAERAPDSRTTAPRADPVAAIQTLKRALDDGLITQGEFDAKKAEFLRRL